MTDQIVRFDINDCFATLLDGLTFMPIFSPFRTHRKHIHEEKSAVCEICGEAFGSLKLLRHHSVIHNEKKISCELCGSQFRTRGEVENHMKR